jgi:VWFA-related protein
LLTKALMKCAVAVLSALLVAAQEPRFESQSHLVLVPVSVTDGKGRPVDGLEPADFVVLDNGRPQKAAVDTFTTGVAPIALVVAVQSSGISAAALAKVQKIGAMIQPLITGDRGRAALVSFDRRIQWRQGFTNDAEALARAFQQLTTGEEKSARMLDAAVDAIERLRRRPNVRRVLLLISESRDRDSETSLDAVLEAAQSAGVTVYASTYSAVKTAFTTKPGETDGPNVPEGPRPAESKVPVPPPAQRLDILGGIGELARLGKTKTTEVLSKGTGGAEFSFARQKGLEDAIEKLGEELHTQYLLSFTPENPAPGQHRLEVKLVRPGKLRVRARPAYWAGQ